MCLAILAWPSSTDSLKVTSSIDSSIAGGITSSWETSVATAAHSGIPFGTHIIFTYGPLGFLQDEQLNYWWTTFASLLFTYIFFASVFAILVRSLRHAAPLAIAVCVAYFVGAVTVRDWGYQIAEVLAIVLVVCVALMSRITPAPAPLWIWAILGVTLGAFSLVQASLGLGIAAVLIVSVASISGGRLRPVGAIVVGALAGFSMGWFGTGNGFGNLMPFLKGSWAIVNGYSAAMSLQGVGSGPSDVFAGLVVVFIGIVAFDHTKGLSNRAKTGVWLATSLVVWLLLKEAFVRHDSHDLVFFSAAPVVVAAFVLKRWSRILIPGMVVIAGMFLFLGRGNLPLVPRPDQSVWHFVEEASTIVSPERTAATIARSRRSLREEYALSKGMVALMSNSTVDISPWEQDVAWAYPNLKFDPLPVIQDYSAYTPSLDQVDVDYLESPNAPRFILRQPIGAIDDRYATFEPPGTQLAIECRYRQVSASAKWQLLERGSNRCGSLDLIETVRTGWGQSVAVPTASRGSAIIARFQLDLGWLSKLETVAFKPPSVFFRYSGNRQLWRFVTATAGDPHVLQSASTLGYDQQFTPASVTRFQLSTAEGKQRSNGITISFYQVRIAAVSPSSSASPGARNQGKPETSPSKRNPDQLG